MLRKAIVLLTVLLAVACVAGIWRVARATASLARARADVRQAYAGEVSRVRLAGVRVRRLTGSAAGQTLDLGSVANGVVFVYAPTCGPCNQNMWNWIDVVRSTPGAGGKIYALASNRTPPDAARAYWRGLAGRVEVLTIDSETMRRHLLTRTPATLLVRGGRVTHEYVGLLAYESRQEVVAHLADTR